MWIAALVPVMGLLIVAFRRFEIHPEPADAADLSVGPVRYVAAGIGVVSIGLGILGFGVTGFNLIATDLGENVLGFNLNPLQNVAHLVLGLAVLWSAYRSLRVALATATALAASFLVVGLLGSSDGIALLGMNCATAWLHVALGAIGLALLGFSLGSAPSRPGHLPEQG
jgi:hypothetical protein